MVTQQANAVDTRCCLLLCYSTANNVHVPMLLLRPASHYTVCNIHCVWSSHGRRYPTVSHFTTDVMNLLVLPTLITQLVQSSDTLANFSDIF